MASSHHCRSFMMGDGYMYLCVVKHAQSPCSPHGDVGGMDILRLDSAGTLQRRRRGEDGCTREVVWNPVGTLLQAEFNQSLASSFPKGWWDKLQGKRPEWCHFKASGQNVIIRCKD